MEFSKILKRCQVGDKHFFNGIWLFNYFLVIDSNGIVKLKIKKVRYWYSLVEKNNITYLNQIKNVRCWYILVEKNNITYPNQIRN